MVTLRPPLSAQALRDSVVGSNRPWRQLDIVDETGSTNADLLARSRAGENVDGVVLIAEHQSAGRGRLGRHWVAAPRAQLLLSVGVDASAVPTERWGWLTLATGIAVVDAVAADTGVRTRLKWPNDVLAGDAKLAGILAEVASPATGHRRRRGAQRDAEAAGSEPAERHIAARARRGGPDRDRLARRLLLELGRAHRRLARRGGDADAGLAADYRDRSATIGAQVRVMLPGEQELVGTAMSR